MRVAHPYVESSLIYRLVQKKFPMFEIPASILRGKMASPCTAKWP